MDNFIKKEYTKGLKNNRYQRMARMRKTAPNAKRLSTPISATLDAALTKEAAKQTIATGRQVSKNDVVRDCLERYLLK